MFERNGTIIRNLETNKAEMYNSINLAKKASAKISKSNGFGSIVVKK